MSQNQATNYSNIQFDADVYSDLFENYSVNCTYITEEGLNNFFKVEDYSAVNMTHINARSLKKNFDKILSLISNISGTLTAIAISETWLTESLQDVFFISGYDFISKQRTEKIGGGVGIYVNSSLNYIVRNDLCRMTNYIECVFIEIVQDNDTNIVIGCIYRPPSSDHLCVETFNSDFSEILKMIDHGNAKTVLLAGDYNLDLINTHSATEDF